MRHACGTCVADSHIAIQHARPHQKLICPVTQMDRVAGPSHQGSRQFGGSELLNSYGSGRGQKSSRRHSTDSVALHELRAALIISRVQSRSAEAESRSTVHHTYIRSQTHAVLCSSNLGTGYIYSCSPWPFSSPIQAKLANRSRYSHLPASRSSHVDFYILELLRSEDAFQAKTQQFV